MTRLAKAAASRSNNAEHLLAHWAPSLCGGGPFAFRFGKKMKEPGERLPPGHFHIQRGNYQPLSWSRV
jgi:hypothetical protein